MGVALTPWSMKMAFNYMTVALNVVMVIPEYRRAPEHKQPAGMRDMRAAFHHFHKNSSQFGFDCNRMVMAA